MGAFQSALAGAILSLLPASASLAENLSSDITVTVGPGGDHPTIASALAALSQDRPVFVNGGVSATIRLLSGFSMAEQINIKGIDLSWITITSEDAVVPVVRSALTAGRNYEAAEYTYPAFLIERGSCPTIGALFAMDDSGEETRRDGFMVMDNSTVSFLPGAGFKDAGHTNLLVFQASRVQAEFGVFSGAGNDNVKALHNNWLNLQSTDLTNAGDRALFVNAGTTAGARFANFSGSASEAIFANRGAVVDAYQATIDTAGTMTVPAVFATGGGVVNLEGATVTNARGVGVSAWGASRINAAKATITHSGRNGVSAVGGGEVSVHEATIADNGGDNVHAAAGTISAYKAILGNAGSGISMRAVNGGVIMAGSSTGNVTSSPAVNTLNAAGIILR